MSKICGIIYGEPQSPNEGVCLRCDEPPVLLQLRLQMGGCTPPPTPPALYFFPKFSSIPEPIHRRIVSAKRGVPALLNRGGAGNVTAAAAPATARQRQRWRQRQRQRLQQHMQRQQQASPPRFVKSLWRCTATSASTDSYLCRFSTTQAQKTIKNTQNKP